MSALFWTSYALLWLIVPTQSLLLFILLREVGRVYLGDPASFARDGVKLGRQLPALKAVTVEGEQRLSELASGGLPTALLCASLECRQCPDTVRALARLTELRPDLAGILVIGSGELGRYASETGFKVAAVAQDDFRKRLGVRATPFMMILDHQGAVIAKGVVNDLLDMERLLEEGGIAHRGKSELADHEVLHA